VAVTFPLPHVRLICIGARYNASCRNIPTLSGVTSSEKTTAVRIVAVYQDWKAVLNRFNIQF